MNSNIAKTKNARLCLAFLFASLLNLSVVLAGLEPATNGLKERETTEIIFGLQSSLKPFRQGFSWLVLFMAQWLCASPL
jgi:hypothetical protein